MSIKKLLGLENTAITDMEIMARISEAQARNADNLEFEVDGNRIRIGMPHVSFDPNADQNGW